VRAQDVAGATARKPAKLNLAGKVAAGEVSAEEVIIGSCVRIFTGSPLPRGADAVVMQEDTQIEPERSSEVLVLEPVRPWENVRLKGEDVRAEATLIRAGEVIRSGKLALLAASGVSSVKVGRQPIVGLVATGTELREAGQELQPGQIYESNRLALAALIQNVGGIPKTYPLVADVLSVTRKTLKQAMEQCDIVVTTGGVSVGEMDFVKDALEAEGGKVQFWRVAIKPGRPFVFGRWEERFLFGLPGNPVSAFVTFVLVVRPALLRWQGGVDTSPSITFATLGEPFTNPSERRHFMRVKVDAKGLAHSAGAQASHMLASLAAADGLVDVPAKTTLAAGTKVQVLRWD